MTRTRALALGLALVVLAACGSSSAKSSGSTPPSSSQNPDANQLQAVVASFDLTSVGPPSRVLIGLQLGNARFIGFGTVTISFKNPYGKASGPAEKGSFILVPGSPPKIPPPAQPELVPATQRGVYETAPVDFPTAGIWTVDVSADVKGLGPMTASTPLQIASTHTAVAVGQKAPPSVNPTIADHGKLPLSAVDSRAQGKAPVPDPILHQVTIKAALAAHRPLVIVVSTPIYCESKFCGPTTDMVESLARQYGKQADFIHVEVWGDYNAQQLNKAAAEWIARGQGDGNEPWVFVVGRDGIVKARFDNVVTKADLVQAIKRYSR
jgi:hypothetical protein